MSVSSHIDVLERKHKALEEELHNLSTSPGVSDEQIMEVKRRKLQIKDELSRLAG